MRTLYLLTLVAVFVLFSCTGFSQAESTDVEQVAKIISLDDFKKTIANQYGHTSDWKNIVHLRNLSWTEDGKTIVIKTDNGFAGPNLWSIGIDGTGLQSMSFNGTMMNAMQYKNQIGNMTVFIPHSSTAAPNLDIMLGTVDGRYQQVLYNDDTTPELPAISPDGKYVVFAQEATSSWDKPDKDGIYLITLSQPVPEFPYASIMLLVSVTSVVVFYRFRLRN